MKNDGGVEFFFKWGRLKDRLEAVMNICRFRVLPNRKEHSYRAE